MQIEVIDAWNMTTTVAIEKCMFQKTSPYYFTCLEREQLQLPGRPMTAIRITPAK
jgi:hypothetical protein